MNDKIVAAIAEGSFGRVIELDKARQEMVQDLCLFDFDDADNHLFDFMEDCIRKNTKMIEDMELKLNGFIFRNNQFNKVRKAYHC